MSMSGVFFIFKRHVVHFEYEPGQRSASKNAKNAYQLHERDLRKAHWQDFKQKKERDWCFDKEDDYWQK